MAGRPLSGWEHSQGRGRPQRTELGFSTQGAIPVPLELCPGGGLTIMREEDARSRITSENKHSKLCRKCDYVLIMQVIFMHLQIPSSFINLLQLEQGDY